MPARGIDTLQHGSELTITGNLASAGVGDPKIQKWH